MVDAGWLISFRYTGYVESDGPIRQPTPYSLVTVPVSCAFLTPATILQPIFILAGWHRRLTERSQPRHSLLGRGDGALSNDEHLKNLLDDLTNQMQPSAAHIHNVKQQAALHHAEADL